MINRAEDGYCGHLDRQRLGRAVYEQRPVVCRGYDCRNDRLIWLDFEKRIVNPDLARPDWPHSIN